MEYTLTLLPLLIALAVHSPAAGRQDEARAEVLREAEEEPLARAVAVAPDGEFVAVAYEGGRVVFLDASDGSEQRELTQGLAEDPRRLADPWRFAFSPDGELLAGLGHLGKLRIWKLTGEDATARVESTDLLEGVQGIEEPDDWAFDARLRWSPAGDRLLVAHSGNQFSLWMRSGQLASRWRTEHHQGGDDTVAWSRDGNVIYYADGESVLLRDGKSGEALGKDAPLQAIRCHSAIVALAVHPTKRLLATGHVGCYLRIWDLDTGRQIKQARHVDPLWSEVDDELACIAWSPSGEQLAISIRCGCYVFVLDPETLTKTWSSKFLGAHFGEAMLLSWSPDESSLWFSFECGSGSAWSVDPSLSGLPSEREDCYLPTFRGDVGVIIWEGEAHLVTADGELRW